jgi:hypothetical protein
MIEGYFGENGQLFFEIELVLMMAYSSLISSPVQE